MKVRSARRRDAIHVCGPVAFMQYAAKQLVELGVNKDNIHYNVLVHIKLAVIQKAPSFEGLTEMAAAPDPVCKPLAMLNRSVVFFAGTDTDDARHVKRRRILPSPILPVCAVRIMAIHTVSISSLTTISIFTFGRKSTMYSAPR